MGAVLSGIPCGPLGTPGPEGVSHVSPPPCPGPLCATSASCGNQHLRKVPFRVAIRGVMSFPRSFHPLFLCWFPGLSVTVTAAATLMPPFLCHQGEPPPRLCVHQGLIPEVFHAGAREPLGHAAADGAGRGWPAPETAT